MAKFPEGFADALLELHNQYRRTHNSPPLQIIDELSESAQEWADHLAEVGKLAYKSDPDYGENIFAGFLRDSPENAKPEDPIELWYREGRYFKYGDQTPRNVEDVRRFTQLVWKATTSLGIGMAIGDDKETYVVCFYQPPGNVPEEFAANVLAPVEEGEETELLPREADEIKTVDIPPKIIESMERLYAVPSEKLRVWSAWLTKIGEMTDEWQQWLRSHIDLAIRIAERLEEAREVLRKSETAAKDKPDETHDKEKKEAASQSFEEEVEEPVDPEVAKSMSKTTTSATTVKTAVSSMVKSESVSSKPRSVTSKAKSVTSKTASKQSVQKSPSAMETSKSEPECTAWPVGVPWTPEEEQEEEVEEDVLEKLPIPRNEAEMKKYLKKFKDEAVLYRSYYKHWRETADQTTSEVGGRVVMATFLVQGKREEALKRIAKARKKDEAARRSKVEAARRARLSKKPSIRSTKSSKSAASAGSVYVTPPQSLSEADDDPAETTEPAEPAEPAAGTDETPEPDETPEKPAETKSEEKLKSAASSKTAVSKVPTEKETEKRDESLEVDELFRDCARSCEPIPYHFYLRCEPDAELADVEDENEEILEVDLTREKMLGTLRRVWYNLAEKPCKGGKPWI